MGVIPFYPLEKDHLSPLEEFLYEKYRLGIDDIASPEDYPPSMQALAKRYPEVGENFCASCAA